MIVSQTGTDAAEAVNIRAQATAGRHPGSHLPDTEPPEQLLPSEAEEEQREWACQSRLTATLGIAGRYRKNVFSAKIPGVRQAYRQCTCITIIYQSKVGIAAGRMRAGKDVSAWSLDSEFTQKANAHVFKILLRLFRFLPSSSRTNTHPRHSRPSRFISI